ncbi:MAG: tetratricopeptide repeat protein [Vicinamibacterales bacterium]
MTSTTSLPESGRTDVESAGVSGTALTLDEAMAVALDRLQQGDADDAEAICRKILDVAPEYPTALHYLGMLRHRQGNDGDALELIRRSLTLVPDQPDWHSNLGIVLQSSDDLEGAMAAFERAIALSPTHAQAHNNLGVLLRVFGHNDRAEAAYRRAIELNPGYADAFSNLAILLSYMSRPREAVTAYSHALALKPSMPDARRLLVVAYCQIGDREKAIATCEQWVKDDPADPLAWHALASVSGQDVPARASDAYIQKTFDSFSRTFEAKLARLDYRAPTLIVDALVEAEAPAPRSLDLLDLGCGTGLCGPQLAPHARRLVGVDLSEGMLEHARSKAVYDELVQGELTAYATGCLEAFDAVVSADTLVYFGSLEDVARAVAGALRPGGRFIFTVEESVDPDRAAPYTIQPHGRFCHTADYVVRTLRDVGLEPTFTRAELRKEGGVPVPGLIVSARRKA